MTETVQTPENGQNPQEDQDQNTGAAAPVGGVDLGELMEAALRKAVQAQINAEAKEMAAGVVAELLTDAVRAEMRAAALVEAEDALNPALADTETPAGEVAEEEAAGEAEEEAAAPEPKYATVEEFVEQWVVPTYRREVTTDQREWKWCPRWHAHGEVYARFKAVHRAFEAMRLDETVEVSLWWLTHLDPHMAVILSPDGPFKLCNSTRHSDELGPLPTTEAAAGTATDGFVPSAFGLWVPAGPPARPREVTREYPG
ncbi:DUF4913 domain-containing protein [Nocardia grenadensis]|uniref:DUF4913 domain-containing protein n=1 Tax=Nocardia grenadensis TaxID=931537 RepID=UPI0007A4B233|nr:DUF4913 domain-containing protein [Nocardia grenadensis]